MIKKIFFTFFTLLLAIDAFAEINSLNNKEQVINSPTPTLKNNTSTNYYQIYNSIMFSPKDIEEISKTLPRFKYLNEFKQGNDNSLDTQILNQNTVKQKSIFNFEQGSIYIYLNSIMYVSKNNWSIWISGNKITNLTNDNSEIKVIDIFPSLVKLAWTFDLNQWEVINPNKLIPESNYTINDDKVTLTFSLSPNQSFLPVLNQIIEGKVKETKVEEKVSNISDKPTPDTTNKQKPEQSKSFDDLFF